MEITSFVLGMLAIIMVAMVTVIVVGIVKILKLNKQQDYLNSALERTRSELYDAMKDDYNNVWRQFEAAGRDVTMIEQTLRNQIDQARQETGKATQTVRTDLSSYIDSRIDKLIDTYFEHVGAKTPPKREFING